MILHMEIKTLAQKIATIIWVVLQRFQYKKQFCGR